MSEDYLFDKQGDDADVAKLEGLLGGFAHTAALKEPPPRRRRAPVIIGAMIGVAAVAAIAIVVIKQPGETPKVADACSAPAQNGMQFAVTQGSATCGGQRATKGTVPVGEWLETARDAKIDVAIAKVGSVTVFPESRVQLVGNTESERRLSLTRGRVSAKVIAPPRLFVIDTPTATAVDLGCAYDLVVDDAGTHLTVTHGAVSLEGKPFGAYVPRGMTVDSRPGHGIGVPVYEKASPDMKAAVARFNGGDFGAAIEIARLANENDIVTLWHMIARTSGRSRAFVVGVLEKLVPIPFDFERADMIAGSKDALDDWRENVLWQWQLDH